MSEFTYSVLLSGCIRYAAVHYIHCTTVRAPCAAGAENFFTLVLNLYMVLKQLTL